MLRPIPDTSEMSSWQVDSGLRDPATTRCGPHGLYAEQHTGDACIEMWIKALAIYKPDHNSGKVSWEVIPCENPMIPPSTHTRLVIDEEVDVSTMLPKTMKIIDAELTFECMKCPFKTASLKEMEDHSNACINTN